MDRNWTFDPIRVKIMVPVILHKGAVTMNTQSVYAALRQISFLLIFLTTLCYAYQSLYLVLPFFAKKKKHRPAAATRYAVLIAARNEEAVLPHLLDSLQAQDYPAALRDIYVVADNCTDRTAEVAKAHGATVFQRFNTLHVGKGYALNFLLGEIDRSVGLARYDAFLIFDADNLLEPDYITQINRTCSDGYEAFCGYRNTKNFGANWLSAGYGVWYLHDGTHLNRSRMALGVTCAVTGTGFGFTRQVLERCGGWHFFTLTEDIEFSNWCAIHGVRIGYCHDAILYDEQPVSFRQSWRQRTRWTQGGLQIARYYSADLFRGLLTGGKTGYACFEALTLSTWGATLAGVSAAVTLLTAIVATQGHGLILLLLKALIGAYWSIVPMGALTVLTEWKRIHTTVPRKIGAIFAFPLFMLTFLPISATAVFRKFRWDPIAHTTAISMKDLQKQ